MKYQKLLLLITISFIITSCTAKLDPEISTNDSSVTDNTAETVLNTSSSDETDSMADNTNSDGISNPIDSTEEETSENPASDIATISSNPETLNSSPTQSPTSPTSKPTPIPTAKPKPSPTLPSTPAPTEAIFIPSPLPIVTYTQENDPYTVFMEVIDRTNECPMFNIENNMSYQDGYIHREVNDSETRNSYVINSKHAVGLDGPDGSTVIHYNVINFYNSGINELYRGYVFNDNYIISSSKSQDYYLLEEQDYKEIFPFYESKPLELLLPKTENMLAANFQDRGKYGEKYSLEFEVNENFFYENIDYFMSHIYLDDPFNIIFQNMSIYCSINEYGIAHIIESECNFYYDVETDGVIKTWEVTLKSYIGIRYAGNYDHLNVLPEQLYSLF